MSIVLTRVAVEATAAGNFRGGPVIHSANPLRTLAIGSATPFYNSHDLTADALTLTTTTGATNRTAVAFHPTLNQVAIFNVGSVAVHSYTPSTGVVGAAIATSAANSNTLGAAIAFTPDGNYIVTLATDTPFVQSISWNGSAFGAWVVPTTQPAATTTILGPGALAISPDGSLVAVATGTGNNGVLVYGLSGGVFSNPPTGPATNPGAGNGVAWSDDGAWLALAHGTSPYVSAWPMTGGTFGDIVQPAVAFGTNIGYRVLFDHTTSAVIVGGAVTTGIALYSYLFTAGVFSGGAEASVEPSDVNGMVLTPDNTRLAVIDGNNDIHLYSTNLTLAVPGAPGNNGKKGNPPGRSKSWNSNWRRY